MIKRISLLGSILMAITLPLYADISTSDRIASDNPPSVLRTQDVNPLITGTHNFSVLDTRRPLNLQTGADLTSLTPAFNLSRPVAPVPEPANYMLMGLGIIGLFLARRDRLSAK